MTVTLGHERNDTIDVFRAIAILSVMAYHYATWTAVTHLQVGPMSLLDLGRFGVHLFFVVSGLVITMTISRSRNVGDFALKRTARIYPAYIVAVLLTFAFTKLIKIPVFWVSIRELLANVLPYDFGQQAVDPSYWSLTYELQFYAYTAAFFLVLKELFWIGLTALTIVGAAAGAVHVPWADRVLMAAYMPLFLAGVATWIAVYEQKASGWIMLAIAVACYFPAVSRFDLRQHAYAPWMLNAYILGLSGTLIALLALHVKLRIAPLAWLGRISYSLYLVHQVIGVSLIAVLQRRGLPEVICFALPSAAVVLLAWAMFHYVEEPGRALFLRTVRRVSARGTSSTGIAAAG